MAEAEPIDPFTQVYDAIWRALRAYPNFKVKAANQKDFTGGGSQGIPKRSVLPADMQETWLVQSVFSITPFGGSSRTCEVTQGFQLISTAGTLRLDHLNAMKFAVLIALSKAGEDLGLPGLVRQWDIVGGQDGMAGAADAAGMDVKHGKTAFDSILTINVNMYFQRQTLLTL